jgi:predicted transcriptional regulator YdeE
LNELPEGVTGVSIPEQQYETFTAKGKMPEALGNSWQDIWQKRMDRTYGFDFEHYDEKSFGEHPEVSIWIGVRSSSR